jgi:hypothetical protein
MVTPLSAERTILPIKKDALANMGFHVTFSGLCRLASAIAKRTIRIGDINQTFTRTHRAFLNVGLSHLF